MSNCPRRTIGWSSCPVIRSQRRICCSCFDSCRSKFLLNRRRKSKPGTIAKSRERSPPVVPAFGAVSQGFQYLGVTQPPQLVKSGYNAQAMVVAESLLVIAVDVVQAPNDKQQVVPMLEKVDALPEQLGRPETLLADNGYFSEANVMACTAANIEPLIATGRQ